MLGLIILLVVVLPHLFWIIPVVKKWNWKLGLIIALFIDAATILTLIIFDIVVDVSWYTALGFEDRFWTEFGTQLGFFFIFFATTSLILVLNNFIAGLFIDKGLKLGKKDDATEDIYFTRLMTQIISIIVALLMGMGFSNAWGAYLKHANATSFGIVDPVFGKDIGFFVFSLPFYEVLAWFCALLLIFMFVSTFVIYYRTQIAAHGREWGDWYSYRDIEKKKQGIYRLISHLSVLSVIAVPIIYFFTKLAIWELVFSSRGAVFGAGYTDINVQIGVYNFFMWVLILSVVAFIVAAFLRSQKRTRQIFLSSVVAIIAIFVGVVIVYPAIYQSVSVSPNELEKEQPYIERNIEFTRKAYGLDSIRVVDFPVEESITGEVIRDNELSLKSIRLWDWRVLLSNNTQHQSLRHYYTFHDVDITRYQINGELVQVMSSARELDQDLLDEQAKTFQNTRFVYTHGNGICMNPVNTFLSGGKPDYWVGGIPSKSTFDELQVTEPRIYYGERTSTPVYVYTDRAEFDYPSEDTNVTCFYQGTGGVPIGTGLKRLAFAWGFDGFKLLNSDELTNQSRIMFRRTLEERIKTLAPFLMYDNDPYQVIAGGKIYFIWDAYTYTAQYPYSERHTIDEFYRLNYIRNSVKVVMDAYNGSVTFVAFDETDPILQTWQKIFPDLFTSLGEVPEYIREHFRYPEDLMYIQARMYSVYHMDNPNVFYNREDAWDIAHELYQGNTTQEVLPYYVIIDLPGEETEEFVQILPFTPRTTDENNPKHNMLAWMAARCDEANYGELVIYRFPKEKRIPGPMQVEILIDQHEDISKDFTLWNQQGSSVIRGNMLTIPLAGNRIIFVEPIYLKAEASEMPELKRVIVSNGYSIGYASTFESSLSDFLGTSSGLPSMSKEETGGLSKDELISEAGLHFEKYQELYGKGKFAEAGQHLEALGQILNQLVK